LLVLLLYTNFVSLVAKTTEQVKLLPSKGVGSTTIEIVFNILPSMAQCLYCKT